MDDRREQHAIIPETVDRQHICQVCKQAIFWDQNGYHHLFGMADRTEQRATLPDGCGYQGYEFGAAYPNSVCFGGRLYDADACDGHGNYYEPTEEIPCPMCHPRKAIEYWTQQNLSAGKPLVRATALARGLVADIRKNRKNGTEPWK